MMLTSASSSVLKCRQIVEFFLVLFFGFFLLVMVTFVPHLSAPSAMYSIPVLPACHAPLRPPAQLIDLRRRPLLYLDLPGGLQDRAFFVSNLSVIVLCLGVAYRVFSSDWATALAVVLAAWWSAADRQQPTLLHHIPVCSTGSTKNVRLAC